MTRLGLSTTYPLVIVAAALSLNSVACGAKGDDDTGAAGMGATGAGATGGTGGGTGATGGTGGSSGSAGMAALTQVFNFDMDDPLNDLWLSPGERYTSSGTKIDGTPAPVLDKTALKLDWVSSGGYGDDGGALQASIPYATESQYAGYGVHLNAEDMTGKKITAHIKLVSGLGDPTDLLSNPGGAKLYAKSGTAYTYAAGVFTNVDATDKWVTLTFDLANKSTWSYEDTANGSFDPSQVGEVGIQFDTGGTTTTAMPAVELIDSVTW